jgi:hypothetical protein
MEQLITLQKYAALHRQSIHTVVKKTMNGELKSIEKEENGKKTTYIVLSEPPRPQERDESLPLSPSLPSAEEEIDYKKAYEDLNKEYLLLKTRYDRLLAETGR